jgi:eukaryotic-like serine/threonine-protein kinase
LPLAAGASLGSYEIVAPLGAGGMGEVWRARDAKLGREVALKVLPDGIATNAERSSRFEREAKVLASLNHPHIAALFGFEEAAGRHFLVMELVEGETIADRLRRGPIPVDEALKVARQIADALETAHEKGVVHRDLKPANLKITPDDRVKVLDFGLARLQDEPSGTTHPGLSHSPTLSLLATEAGVILGTAGYMSPEQAKGTAADHRSDIFSFGAVLYEMLTGRQAFQADTPAETMAAVLMREPEFNALPSHVNPRVVELLRRCLEKVPKRRWQAAGDLRAEIESILAAPVLPPSAIVAPRVTRPLWLRALPLAITAIISATLVGVIVWWAARPSLRAGTVVRFSMPLPEGQGQQALRMVAVSPDGTQLVYAANSRLYLRALAETESKPIAGTDQSNAVEPVFSPDGQSVAFVSVIERALKRVPVAGGVALSLCPIDPRVGLSWDRDSILFSEPAGIMRVRANGGKPETLVKVASGERAYGPHMLPDGETLLFTLAKGASADAWDSADVVAQSLKSGERRTILKGGSDARYLPSGHLVYAVRGVLYAVAFDPARFVTSGAAVPVVVGVRRPPGGVTGSAHYSVSESGSLAYVSGPASAALGDASLGWIDETGAVSLLKLPRGPYESPRISPDGTRLVFGRDDGNEANIWVYALDGSSAEQRLTFGGRNRIPVWSGDGRRIAFQSDRDGDVAIWWQPADISGGGAERLTTPEAGTAHVPESWSRTDDRLSFSAITGTTTTLWTLSVRDRKASPFDNVRSPSPLNSEFSPDGKWIAYTMREGVIAVFVEPFPATGAKVQISRVEENGHHPVWSRDGTTLFYIPGAQPLAGVNIATRPAFSVGNPRPTKLPNNNPVGAPRNFDIAADGRRFIFTTDQGSGTYSPEVQVVVNWHEELKRLVPIR